MVGRELTDRYPQRDAEIGEPMFEVRELEGRIIPSTPTGRSSRAST